jgi:hypothetical protein
MRERFLDINFRKKTRDLIDQANTIINEYQARGFTLTVRQLYYQFVARDWIKNTPQNYERVASVVDDARKAGLIDWAAIEDRTRFLRGYDTFTNPQNFLNSYVEGYKEDLWRDQDYHVEVWIEKDALLGVIEGVCEEHRVDYFACRGYPSSSELYKAGKRLRRYRDAGKWPIVLYLGDHDPSGLQMVLNSDSALQQYGRNQDVEVKALALTREQIEEFNPPPNYAKESDSRYFGYVQATGTEECWELDALDPGVIDGVIRENIDRLIDWDKFKANELIERGRRDTMRSVVSEYADGAQLLRFLQNHTPAIDSELLSRELGRTK